MRSLSACLGVAALSGAAVAGTAYDNLGPDDGFQVASWLIGNSGFDQDVGMMFMSASSGELAELTLALSHYDGPNFYDISLNADACGTPGAQIYAWSAVSSPAEALVHVQPAPGAVQLTAGFNYWVVVEPTNGPVTTGGWNRDTITGNDMRFAFAQFGGAWSTQCGDRSAMRVETIGGAPACEGDVNGDGVVNLADLSALLTNFGLVCP